MNYKEEMLNALTDVCKKARSEGFASAKEVYTRQVDNVRKEAYKKGVEDTWEAARKIVFQKVNLLAIFNLHWGDHSTDVLRDYSGVEAIAKLKEYETKLEEYEKEQKKECESCFTEKLTEEKWVSAEECKECKQQQTEKKCSCCENRHQELACRHCKDFDKFVDERVIRVGDVLELADNGNCNAYVTKVDETTIWLLFTDGSSCTCSNDNLGKVFKGRHSYILENMLYQLRKDENKDGN